MSKLWAHRLQEICEYYEHKAHTGSLCPVRKFCFTTDSLEPDFDFAMRDGFFDYDEYDEYDTGTYVNIDNYTSGETMMDRSVKRLVKIETDSHGNIKEASHITKKPKYNMPPVIEESSLTENFEKKTVGHRRSSTFLTPSAPLPSARRTPIDDYARLSKSAPQSLGQILKEYKRANPNLSLTPSQRQKRGIPINRNRQRKYPSM